MMQQVIDWCLDNWGPTLFVVTLFVQFTPAIKFSPITAICTWVGKLITADVVKEISSVRSSLKDQERNIDENEMDRIRWEVLDFANSCRNGRKHTKDEFEHIIAQNGKYHRLLDKYEEENGVFEAEYKYILELYEKCQRENTFL